MFMKNEGHKSSKRAKIESCDECNVQVEELRIEDSRERRQNLIRYLISALPKLKLQKLLLSRIHIHAKCARALAYALPDLTLHKLNLTEIYINDNDAARELAHGISQNNTIEILELEELTASEDVANLMISCLSNTSSLKTFKLFDGYNGHVTDNVMMSLADTLVNSSTLEELEITNCTAVSSIGWLGLSRALGSPRSSLKKLKLWDTPIDDTVIFAFGNDLSRNASLEVLIIKCDEDRPIITSEGWLAFSRLLGSNLSNLREIDISLVNDINTDAIIIFINELSGNENSLLKYFFLPRPLDPTDDIWHPIVNLLCNTSSIDATWSSNHTLCDLGHFVAEESDQDSDDEDSDIFNIGMPQEVLDLLEMNENEDKKQVARRKVIKHHFSEDFDLSALIGSDQRLIPRKISWFGRDALGLSVVFSIMRKLPDLCQK